MLTGACPFEAPTPAAAIASVLQNSVDPDPRITPHLWLELQRALSKRPKQRHASASEMRRTMLGVLGETEDSLAPMLKGVKARDFVAVRTGPVFTPSSRDAETQSVGGQSVATVAPQRRMAAWWAWAAVGALVGSGAMVVAMTQGRASGAPPALRSAVTATATAVPDVPPVEPTASPVLVSVESIPVATPPPSATASSARPALAPPHTPHHAAPKPHLPKPVATSPGF
jgi:hypothetical protein